MSKYSVSGLFGAFVSAMVVSQASAVLIYDEDFTGQLGKGIAGPESGNVPTVLDFSGVDWTIDYSLVNMTGGYPGDYMLVEDAVRTNMVGEHMYSKDPGGPSVWISPAIDISGYTSFEILLDTVSGNAMPEHCFATYQIDAGTEATFYAATTDGFGPDESSGSVATGGGSSLVIRVTYAGSSGVQSFGFDNVQVDAVPEPATMALMAIGGLVMIRRRSRRA